MQSEPSLIYLQAPSDWRRTREPSPETLCVSLSLNTGWLDRSAFDTMAGPYWESRESLQWWRDCSCVEVRWWCSKLCRWNHSRNSTRETRGIHDAVPEPERMSGGPVSHNRSQTSLRSVRSVHEIASLARSPSFPLPSQSTHGNRLQPICFTSEVPTTLWWWIIPPGS